MLSKVSYVVARDCQPVVRLDASYLNQNFVAEEPISMPRNPRGAETPLVFGPSLVENRLKGKALNAR